MILYDISTAKRITTPDYISPPVEEPTSVFTFEWVSADPFSMVLKDRIRICNVPQSHAPQTKAKIKIKSGLPVSFLKSSDLFKKGLFYICIAFEEEIWRESFLNCPKPQ